jgi:hypothetical protein
MWTSGADSAVETRNRLEFERVVARSAVGEVGRTHDPARPARVNRYPAIAAMSDLA